MQEAGRPGWGAGPAPGLWGFRCRTRRRKEPWAQAGEEAGKEGGGEPSAKRPKDDSPGCRGAIHRP